MKRATALRCESCGAPLELQKCDYCGTRYVVDTGGDDLFVRDYMTFSEAWRSCAGPVRTYSRVAIEGLLTLVEP